MKRLFDSNALWFSMLIGAFGYKWLLTLSPILPWLIFFMLFFTFCKVNPLDLRLHRWHWVVLGVQLSLSLIVYFALITFTHNPILAQGMLMCFIMPTATAAPIIAGKLGGSIQNLTTFTLLSNFATTIIVPATFPLISQDAQLISELQFSTYFWPAFLLLLSRIGPLLLGPFCLAWLVRVAFNFYYKRKYLAGEAEQKEFELSPGLAQIPFYLWVASIIVLSATVTQTVITYLQTPTTNDYSPMTNIIILIISSFFACLIQFGLGKFIGYRLPAPSKGRDYQDVLINPAAAPTTMAGVSSITAGQALGQKNTSLGVWMAQTYLNPMASLGAAAYIIWQNVFNSLQLTLAARKK